LEVISTLEKEYLDEHIIETKAVQEERVKLESGLSQLDVVTEKLITRSDSDK
jgi:hypothetical protein